MQLARRIAQAADGQHHGHQRPGDVFLAARHDAPKELVEFEFPDQTQRQPRPAEGELVFDSHVSRVDFNPFGLHLGVLIE